MPSRNSQPKKALKPGMLPSPRHSVMNGLKLATGIAVWSAISYQGATLLGTSDQAAGFLNDILKHLLVE
jgi:hypothetical protein